jgi:hypothetical protein
MKPRIYASRLAARALLQRIYYQFDALDPHKILRRSLNSAADLLQLKIEPVPSILGDNRIAGALDRTAKRIQIATKYQHPNRYD